MRKHRYGASFQLLRTTSHAAIIADIAVSFASLRPIQLLPCAA
jgi:hypothetical protein